MEHRRDLLQDVVPTSPRALHPIPSLSIVFSKYIVVIFCGMSMEGIVAILYMVSAQYVASSPGVW